MTAVSLEELINAGCTGDRLISFPTDTVPALAVRPDRADLIFAAKQRNQAKPLILMAASATDLWPYVSGSETEREIWQQVVTRYWPGALTLVLPASDRLPVAINPTDPTTIGIRVPNSAIARHILAHTKPLATTSINRSGEPPLQTLTEINAQFPDVLTLESVALTTLARSLGAESEVEGAIASSTAGIPSTVAKWTEQGWEILRQGVISLG